MDPGSYDDALTVFHIDFFRLTCLSMASVSTSPKSASSSSDSVGGGSAGSGVVLCFVKTPVNVSDLSLVDYIATSKNAHTFLPHTQARQTIMG